MDRPPDIADAPAKEPAKQPTEQPAVALDLRGLRCPLPVLKTRKALSKLAPGAALSVLTDDPLAGVDIPNYVREAGEVLVGEERLAPGWRFLIRRAAKGA